MSNKVQGLLVYSIRLVIHGCVTCVVKQSISWKYEGSQYTISRWLVLRFHPLVPLLGGGTNQILKVMEENMLQSKSKKRSLKS